jgi:adenylosuccinate synthase
MAASELGLRARTDRIVVALSGPVGSGKTTVANALQRAIRAQLVSIRGLLRDRALSDERRTLQELGEELEQRVGGWWVAEPALKASVGSQRPVIVDAVRTAEQLAAIRTGAQLVHLHLTALEAVLDNVTPSAG